MNFRSWSAYTIIAGLCALLYNVIVIGFDAVGISFVIAILVSYVVVSVFGYGLHTRFTFRVSPSLPGLVRYAAAFILNIPLLVAVLWVLTRVAGLPVPIASPASTLIMFVVNYSIVRFAITKGPSSGLTG